MVALLSKDRIQSLNIDTVERAIVFATTVLRAAIVGKENEKTDNFDISIDVSVFSKEKANLALEVNLPFNAYQFNTNGGVLLDSLEELLTFEIPFDTDLNLVIAPNTSSLTIPDYDESQINTFEKYLVYYSQILWASVDDPSSSLISLSLLGNQEDAQISISANLPFSLNKWLQGQNYFNSLIPAVSSYLPPFPSGGGQPPGQPEIKSYSDFYEGLAAYSITEFHTVTNAGILESITVEADYDSDNGIYDTYFYLNDIEIYPDIYDNGDQTYELVFDTDNEPIFLEPGDVLSFELYEEPEPSSMFFNIYILEFPSQN